MQRLDEDQVFDHFYLDMNGIIHQCTHPDDNEIAITDHEEMFAGIFLYTERLFRIIGPRKLMFLAIDGVAPRAKMNQQRSRRFRSAKDAERALDERIARGDPIPSGEPFDSNCITPGTQFMHELSVRFRAWIDEKMRTDPAWQQGCTVVFSGSEVPGEGEHKIMDYYRAWKASDAYSPETRHCMYGLDADLIMLGLVSHAPHFTLVREKMRFGKGGRKVPQMRGTDRDADEFELLEIAMLRDMLFLEFKRGMSNTAFERPQQQKGSRRRPNRVPSPSELTSGESDSESGNNSETDVEVASVSSAPSKPGFKVDARRVTDDFLLLCFLVGNDFIPHLAHLDIAEGAINVMFRIYKELLPVWGGYLTDGHRLHPDRLESFLGRISENEAQYFSNRAFTDNVPEYKTPTYRRAYYQRKFGFDVEGEDGEEKLDHLRQIYMEGLHWVLQYYHNGVSSWNWYYPNFYAVLASDMVGLRSVKILFQRGRPFSPLTQLMAVLPPESARFLPEPMRNLMIQPDSPVVDFYPLDFDTDQNGKRNAWEAIVVIPFIDETRLLDEISKIDSAELTEEDRIRDKRGPEFVFSADDYPRAEFATPPVRPSKFRFPQTSPRFNGRGKDDQSAMRSGYTSASGGWRSTPPPSGRGRDGARGRGRSNGRGRGSSGGRGQAPRGRGGSF